MPDLILHPPVLDETQRAFYLLTVVIVLLALGVSALAAFAVTIGQHVTRRYRIRRARAAYRRGRSDAASRQFLTPATFGRLYGPYARWDDHEGTVVSLQTRRERRRS